MQYCTGYDRAQLHSCVTWLWSFFNAPSPLLFVREAEEVTDEKYDYIVQRNAKVLDYLLVRDVLGRAYFADTDQAKQ